MGSLNPFLIPGIISQWMSHLDFDSLKKCRLVCKLWEDEGNRVLHIKKCPLVLCKDIFPREGKLLEEETGSERYEGYPEVTNRNYLLVPLDIGPEYFSQTLQALDLLGQVKYIELQNAGWSIPQLKGVLSLLPKLEELILSEDFVLPRVDQYLSLTSGTTPPLRLHNLHTLRLNLRDENLQNLANIEFLLDLYSVAPNLSRVKCWTGLFSEPASPHTTLFSNILLRSVVEGAWLNKCGNITHLDINLDLRSDDVDLLQTANLPLTTLHIPLDIMISLGKVDDLLRSLQGTLRRLKLTHRNCVRSAPDFRNLGQLEVLRIQGGYDIDIGRNGNRFCGFPGAEHTVIYVCNNLVPLSMFPSHFETFSSPLEELQEVELSSVYFIPKDVYNFKTLFPNLRRIKVSFLDDEMLRSIFAGFPELEVLIGMEGLFTDAGITGISPDVQELLCNGVMDEVRRGGGGVEGKNIREFPSIVRLQKLRTLHLSSSHVTDFGVINGISLCGSVQDLKLGFPLMGDISLKKLCKNLCLDSLNIMSGTFSLEVVNQTKESMRGGSFTLFLLNKYI